MVPSFIWHKGSEQQLLPLRWTWSWFNDADAGAAPPTVAVATTTKRETVTSDHDHGTLAALWRSLLWHFNLITHQDTLTVGLQSERSHVYRPVSVTKRFRSVASLLRLAILPAATLVLFYVRLQVHAGASLYKWSILENQMAQYPLVRCSSSVGSTPPLTVLFLFRCCCHSDSRLGGPLPPGILTLFICTCFSFLSSWRLIMATPQSFPSLFEGLPVSLYDWARVACILFTYAFVSATVVLAIMRRNKVVVLGLFIGYISFIPASNVFIYVGTEVAERLLYIPR